METYLTLPTTPGAARRLLNSNWAIAFWVAFLLLAIASSIVIAPEVYRQAVNLTDPDISVADAALMRHSLDQIGISTKFIAIVQGVAFGSSWITAVILGWLLIRKSPRNGFAFLLALSFVAQAASVYPPAINDYLPDRPGWALVVRLMTVFGISMLFNLAFIFPTGRFVPRWTAIPAVYGVFGVTSLAFFPERWSDSTAWKISDGVSTVLFLGCIIFSVIYRYRRVSDYEHRQQTKWVVFGLLIGLPGFFLGDAMMRNIGPGFGGILSLLGFTVLMPIFTTVIPVSIALAVLRKGLFEIDILLNRTLVWVAMTAAVILTYVGIVLGIGGLLGSDRSLLLSLIATGLVAVGFQPLRLRVQRTVNRLLFGERDDPYGVLTRLGQRIEASVSHDELLPEIVRATAEALRLPYLALFVRSGERDVLAAMSGAAVPGSFEISLIYQGQSVGTLAIGPRGPGETFGPADRRLLEDLARQVGAAAHSVRLTTDLQQSRERIVTAREEERRRLRRDLHDGLGAQLAGLSIQASVARSLIQRDPEQAEQAIAEMRDELRGAIADIRRLVQGLRPPAIDELGLISALSERVQRFAVGGTDAESSGVAVTFHAPSDLPSLPAALEVAIYRITEEALTNVVKHASASRTDVRIDIDELNIYLVVADDGLGLKGSDGSGVGMHSMRERTEELGGRFEMTNVDPHGVRIEASFPRTRDRGVGK